MAVSSAVRAVERWSHSSALVWHCLVSSSRNSLSESFASVSAFLSASFASLSSVFASEIAAFFFFSAVLNFFSFCMPNIFSSKISFNANSSSKSCCLLSLKSVSSRESSAIMSLDRNSYAGGFCSRSAVTIWRCGLLEYRVERAATCARSSLASFMSVFEFLIASIAARTASMASAISLSASTNFLCSLSRFFFSLAISSSIFVIFLPRAAMSAFRSAISVDSFSIAASSSSIFSSDFSMLFCLKSACSLQKQAYLSYSAASFAPSSAICSDNLPSSWTTFSTGVTATPELSATAGNSDHAATSKTKAIYSPA
mmetsp:Transcript_55898/g.111056  ORF Transcript_55898/g.111056 Transcript_55898/m.111056 type:complete len:313 (+) Transcript_55898:1454-2392(+)